MLVAGGWDDTDEAPMWAFALMQIPLWLGLAGAVVVAVKRRGSGSLAGDVGLRMRASDVPIGLALGVVAQFALSYVLMWPLLELFDKSYDDYAEPARKLADRAEASSVLGIVLFALAVVVVAPLVEELFWRGLVHRAAVRALGVPIGVAVTALAFGLAHGQLLQLTPLVAFGLLLSVAAQRTGRLGLGIWTHAGFNATTVVLLLLDDGVDRAAHAVVHLMWLF